MHKLFHLLLLFSGLLFGYSVFAQNEPSPYYLSLKREIIYGGSGLIGTAAGTYLNRNVKPITFGELRSPNLLDIDQIDILDDDDLGFEFAPKSAGQLSDITLYTSLGLPALFLGHKRTRRDFGTIGLLYLETMLINQAITDITKYTVLRPRPLVWTEGFTSDHSLSSNDRASFFSGHTSGSAAASFFFARVFSDYFPDSQLKPYVWGVAATLPTVTGYLRVKAGKHYPTDVLIGYLVGGAVGYLVPTLHRRPLKERRLKVSPGIGGFNLNLEF